MGVGWSWELEHYSTCCSVTLFEREVFAGPINKWPVVKMQSASR